jgi:hypothetical protein
LDLAPRVTLSLYFLFPQVDQAVKVLVDNGIDISKLNDTAHTDSCKYDD